MSQNRSSAVMQQRAEPHNSLDDFPTPPWATRALIEHVIWPNISIFAPDQYLRSRSVWEPACNRGFMARPLKDYFRRVYASDVHDYSDQWDGQDRVVDFLFPGSESPCIEAQGVNWVISNPPFRLAEQFIERSFQFKNWEGTAMLVRTAFLEGVGRYERLFKRQPPSFVAQFTERVPMLKGRVEKDATTATAYCWLVWMDGEEGTRLVWIPPCRKRLEKEGDYDEGNS